MTDDRPEHLRSNQPPPEETAGMEIDQLLAELTERRDEILPAFGDDRLVVTDNATAGTTADKIAIGRAFLKRVDEIRARTKEPYDRAAATVQSRVARFIQPVVDALDKGERKIREFRADARRRAADALAAQREEEARLEAAARGAKLPEEAAAEAAGTETVPTVMEPRVEPIAVRPDDINLGVARGDFGAKVSDQREVSFAIVDVRKLPDEILTAPAVEKAMLAAIKTLYRLKKDIPGVRVDTAMGDKIRRAG